ncbi:LysM domain-containing protein [Lachnospiraceae bacterium 62-35]
MGELYNPYPKLPKNIRQIGERDSIVRLYLEDYVNTYLKRLYPVGGQTLRVGLLLGSREEYDGVPYIFIDGALEMDDVAQNGEKVEFYEGAWKKAYQDIEQMFPKRTVQGWFLCGSPGCQLSPLNYWKQHGQYFSSGNKLMYLNSGLENEEAVYAASTDGFYKLRGHNIYYERNQMMQDYMISRREARRVDAGVDNTLIHNFRQKMEARKVEISTDKQMIGVLGTLCSVLTVTVLAGGITMMNNYHRMKEMESVIASVMPSDISFGEKYKEEDGKPEVVIQSRADTEIAPETMINEGSWNDGQALENKEGQEQISQNQAGMQNQGSSQGQGSGQSQASGQGGGQEQSQKLSQSQESEQSRGSGQGQSQSSSSQSKNGNSQSNQSESGQSVQSSQGTQGTGGSQEAQSSSDTQNSQDRKETNLNDGKQEEQDTRSIEEIAAAGGHTIYEVSEGESLFGICMKKYHDANMLEEICRINGLEDGNKIKSGQKLIMP